MTAPGGWDLPEPSDEELRDDNIDVVTPVDTTVRGSTLGRTDWDNACRLALYEAQNVRYINDLDVWFKWSGIHWSESSPGDRFNIAARVALLITDEAIHIDDEDDRGRHMAWAQQSLSETRLRAMINVASGIPDLRINTTELDASGELLNLPNCTLNPITLEWHEHRREDMLTQLCPTTYDEHATSQLLNDFLTRFLPDEKERDYLLQVVAVSALSYGNAARKLVLLLGPTSTGKSTLMELAQKTLGTDYTTAVNPSVFRGNLEDKPRPDLLRALKSRLVLAFEASDRWELHTDQIKRMTGGDTITARGMRSDIMNEITAKFVPIIVANSPPMIAGSDDALRRRLLALVMDTPVAEDEDDGRLRFELVNDETSRRALLAMLVRIYHDCGGKVTLPIPHRFAERTMELFAALDDVDYVLRELKDDGSIYDVPADTATMRCVPTMVLFKCYKFWIESNGTHQMKNNLLGPKQFLHRLQSLGYEVKRSGGSHVLGLAPGTTRITNMAQF